LNGKIESMQAKSNSLTTIQRMEDVVSLDWKRRRDKIVRLQKVSKKPLYKRNKLAQINKTLSHLRKKYHNDSGSNSLVTNDRKPEGKVTVEWEG